METTTPADRLERLKRLVAKHGVGYYLVLTQDEHNSEYVSPADKRREAVTGFNGSAGTAIIGRDQYAELATDGRYWLQAGRQLDSHWTLRKEGKNGVSNWAAAISQRAKAEGETIGVDARLISYSIAKEMLDMGADLRSIEPNLVDLVWENRPAEPSSAVFALPTEVVGQSTGSKLADLRHQLKPAHADAIVLSALDEVAWLLNLRGSDIQYNPVFKSYVIVTPAEARLYISAEHPLPDTLKEVGVEVRPYTQIFSDLKELAVSGTAVWVPKSSSWALVDAAGPNVIMRASPVEAAKATKNATEISGAKRAQEECGLSVVRYLAWLQEQIRAGKEITEYEGSLKLLQLREEAPDFRGLSFETISSSGPNAAVIHYAPPESGSKVITADEVYLLDSGSQYTFGTTDTTRTVWLDSKDPPAEITQAYTLVLKGHIALATAVFPLGTSGYQLDPFARQFLWRYGMDYMHGTGHGVGSFLNVHEGPIGIGANLARTSTALEVGNLISNEPGYYRSGKFGIRIESMLVVKAAHPAHRTPGKEFLQFDTITLVPLDQKLIDTDLLTPHEVEWINEYHSMVRDALAPKLTGYELAYLERHTAPIPSYIS